MCFNWITAESRPSKTVYKVTLKTTVKGAWEMIGGILEEHVEDDKFTDSEQDEINKVLDGVVNFLEDFVENYEDTHCEDRCDYCEIFACQENFKTVLDFTNNSDIHKVSQVVEIVEFDGRVY